MSENGGREPTPPIEWEVHFRLPTSKQTKLFNALAKRDFNFDMLEECALEAGFAPGDELRQRALASLRRFSSNEHLQAALHKQGIDYDKIAQKLAELMEAREPKYNKPDNPSQLKAVELAMKVHDALPSTKLKIDRHDTHEYVITEDVQERIRRARQIEAEVIVERNELPEHTE